MNKIMKYDSVEYHNENGELHSENDIPAKQFITYFKKKEKIGTRFWYKNGLLHRENNPAIIYSNGEKKFYLNGEEIRTNGSIKRKFFRKKEIFFQTKFEKALQSLKDNLEKELYSKDSSYSFSFNDGKRYKIIIEENKVFVRFIILDYKYNCSRDISIQNAYCFIAKSNGETKYLGKYKFGDIFKPKDFKSPKKENVGNIFEIGNNLPPLNINGINYSRKS